LPQLTINSAIRSLNDVEDLLSATTDELLSTFSLAGYEPEQAITFKVAV